MSWFNQLQVLSCNRFTAQWASSSSTSAVVFLRPVCTSCEMRGEVFGKIIYLVQRGLEDAGSWDQVMALQQCQPGKVMPHHCQLLSDKEKGDGECGHYLLIKQLKTFALQVTEGTTMCESVCHLQLKSEIKVVMMYNQS